MQRPTGFKPSEISSLVNEEVIQQHAEEAAFQWLVRNRAVLAPNYNLQDLVNTDERLEANLDGLRIAGDYGWQVAEEQLAFEEPGEIFVAGVLAFESRDDERIQKVLAPIRSDIELSGALISSLGWTPLSTIEALIGGYLTSDVPELRLCAVGACAVHRHDPGDALASLLNDPEATVRARALKAVGELGRSDLGKALLHYSTDDDDECRFSAAWSAARLGQCSDHIASVLGDFVVLQSPQAELALAVMLPCMGDEQALKLFRKLKSSEAHQRMAAIVAGIAGEPSLVPYLIEMMADDGIARTAGEAFSTITGVDIEYKELDRDAPEGFESGPSELPEDEDVELDPEEDLPWPNQTAIEAWWQTRRQAYINGKQYLRGEVVDINSLEACLRAGNQRQRNLAALKLAVGHPEQPLFEVRAPAKRQKSLLHI